MVKVESCGSDTLLAVCVCSALQFIIVCAPNFGTPYEKECVIQAVQDLLLQPGIITGFIIFLKHMAPCTKLTQDQHIVKTVLCLSTANFTTTVAYQSTVY